MNIIDFDRKGNVIRFCLGEKTDDWGWTNKDYKDSSGKTPTWLKPSDTFYGDDWDDAPYEHNAGTVYEEFIKGHKDIFIPYDDLVLEPCSGDFNSNWRKDDMVARRVPCIIVIPRTALEKMGLYEWQIDSCRYALDIEGAIPYYFGDEMEADS